MKYTIEGFSQEYATTLKKTVPAKDGKEKLIKIDCTDLVILRWFVDFYPNMKKMNIDGKEYVWLAHNKMLTDLPLLDISKRACIERMQKLVEFGILEYKLIKEGGTFSLYTFGENYMNLVQSNDTGVCSNGVGVYGQPTQGGIRSTDTRGDGQPDNKDNSISDTSIKKDSSIEDKDTPQAGEPPSPKAVPIDYDLFKDIYNKFCSSLPQVKLLSDKRKKAIRDFLKQLEFRDFEMACKKANENNFLTGSNDRGWKADFDFIIKVDKALNIIEGKYDNEGTGGSNNGSSNSGSNAEAERPSWSGNWF